MSLYNRDNPFEIQITNPACPGDSSPIIKTIQIGDNLYFFKENSIHSLLTADSIDPLRESSQTKHHQELLYPIGCSSEYVAEVIIQAEVLFNLCDKGSSVFEAVWALNKHLLECHFVTISLKSQIDALAPQCNQIVLENQHKPTIPALPKISNLEAMVGTFLQNAKFFLIKCFKLLDTFYEFGITDWNEAKFDKHLTSLQAKLKSTHSLLRLINGDIHWIRQLAECRNAFEHPGDGQILTISNIRLTVGNKISMPEWTWDLSKKLELLRGPYDLHHDLNDYCLNMKDFLLDILLITSSEFAIPKFMRIVELAGDHINPACPYKFEVSPNPSVMPEWFS